VDEGDVLGRRRPDLLDDVDGRAADAALAELRGGEGDDDRSLGEHVGQVVLQQVLGPGTSGVERGGVAADVVSVCVCTLIAHSPTSGGSGLPGRVTLTP
jgi:hypothetical protein